MSEQQTLEYVEDIREEILNATVDPDMKKLDEQVIPMITELLTLPPGSYAHPTTKDFFNWLVDQHRTEREYLYAIVNLGNSVLDIMRTQFYKYVTVPYDECYFVKTGSYFGKIAIEALAVICPIFKGNWEKIVWIVIIIQIGSHYDKDIYGIASKQLCSYIIHIIGDQEMCPNVNLRFWFMSLLFKMTDPCDYNREQALDSIFLTCSTLHIENRDVTIDNLKNILTMMAEDGFLLEFDERLASGLLDMKASRLSAIVHDVTLQSAIRPFNYQHPLIFYGISALIKYLSQRSRLAIAEDFTEDSCQDINTESDEIVYLYQVILKNFNKSLRTPQLADQTFLYERAIKDLYNATKFEYSVIRRDRYNHINCDGCPDCPESGVLVDGVIYPDLASAP